MEIWDLYNRDRIKTGKTMVRGGKYEKDAYHIVIHVCIFNHDGKMLIQQRQPFKKGWPGMWDVTVCGSAVTGEDSRSAARREVGEELGYKLDLTNIRPSLTINFEFGFDDVYLVEDDPDINKMVLQKEEVRQVKWASNNEITDMIGKGIFIPYYKGFIDLLFDMRKHPGVHSRKE